MLSQNNINQNNTDNIIAIICVVISAIGLLTAAFVFGGTGDSGDSLGHYFLSKYAFNNPQNFLDHWAKPFFVLCSVPFAQMGFIGIKIFNILCTLISLVFTYLTARNLGIKNAWLTVPIAMLCPMYALLTLSGLTEPMFAMVCITAIYGIISHKKIFFSVLLLSFLPFVRSEGLIIIGVTGIYFFISKQYKYLPLLAAGHLIYSLIGYFYYGSFLWVFTKIPYATLSSVYGKGNWNHFLLKMYEVTGVINLCLLIVGFLWAVVAIFSRFKHFKTNEIWLIYGNFVAFITAHSIFWYLGIFNSFGLLRVVIGVIPLISLIALRGTNGLLNLLPSRIRPAGLVIIFALILIFPLTKDEAGWKKKDFELNSDQIAQTKLFDYLQKQYPDYKNYYFYYEAPYLSVLLNHNYYTNFYNHTQKVQPNERLSTRLLNASPNPNDTAQLKHPALIIWDDWYAPTEAHTPLATFANDTLHFKAIKTFEYKKYDWENLRTTTLFVSKK